MIVKAVRNGVRPERIAAALNISVRNVRASMKLLDGIHKEAVDLLKDKAICPKAIQLLKQVGCVRQIEIAELMVSANNYTAGYAEALVLGTPKAQLAQPEKPKSKRDYHPKKLARWSRRWNLLSATSKPLRNHTGKTC